MPRPAPLVAFLIIPALAAAFDSTPRSRVKAEGVPSIPEWTAKLSPVPVRAERLPALRAALTLAGVAETRDDEALAKAAGESLSQLTADFDFINSFGIDNMGVRKEAVCAVPEPFWEAYRKHYSEMAKLTETLKSKHALGWAALEAAPEAEAGYLRGRLAPLERQAEVQLPGFIGARAQCRYDAQGLGRTAEGRAALEKTGSPFAAKPPDRAGLDAAFDGALGRGELPGEPTASAGGPGAVLPEAAVPGFKPKDVPLDSFEALTAGIAFSGPDKVPGFLGIMKDNPAKEAFGGALRHLYSIPVGQEILRDVQRMRERLGEAFLASKPRTERELAAASSELARLEADPTAPLHRVQEAREKVKFLGEVALPALQGDAKPVVAVSFEETRHGVGGTAGGPLTIWKFDGMPNPVHTSRVVLNPDILEDGNPARAVDKLLAHELTHTADTGRLSAPMTHGVQWLLIEDRAFLRESQAVLEQRTAMRQEPGSAFVQTMYDGDAAPMLRDPAGARGNLFSRTNYVWHVTPADFPEPEAALRSRLGIAYSRLAFAGKEHLAAEVKTLELHGPGIGEAFRRARAEAKKEGGHFDEQARFIELAASSRAGRNWVQKVGQLGRDYSADTPEGRRLRGDYEAMEREYFEGLAKLARGNP